MMVDVVKDFDLQIFATFWSLHFSVFSDGKFHGGSRFKGVGWNENSRTWRI